MGEAKTHKVVSASCSIGFDPITGAPTIYPASGKEASAFQILGYLFVAGAHFLRDLFTDSHDEELGAEEFTEYLGKTQIELKQDDKGRYFLAAGDKNVSEKLQTFNSSVEDCAAPDPTTPNVTVESKHGNTVYHIYNLTININADVVTQLNMNPEKVINLFEHNLEAEINKIANSQL